MTDEEYREKRAKGLCFKCDDKWFINHVCSRKESSVLIEMAEENELLGDGLMVEEMEEEGEEADLIGISLNSVVGITIP